MAGFSSHKPTAPITGINVTPLVDIALVLLIVFMLTAKFVVSRGMPLDLPQAASGGEVQDLFSVELAASGGVFVDGEVVKDDADLLQRAQRAQSRRSDLRALVRADGTVQHSRVMHALDVLRQAGVARVAFAVAPAVRVQ